MTAPSNLREVLDKNLDDLGLFQKARKHQVYILWPRIVGELAQNAFPRRVDGDVLYVATSSSVWSQELTFMAPSILGTVNQALGGMYFREIRFSEHLWRPTSKAEGDFQGNIRRNKKRRIERLAAPSDGDLLGVFSRLQTAMRHRVAALKAKGYASCSTCGYLFPKTNRECPMCKVRREFYGYNRAIAMLDQRPYLTDAEVCQALGSDEWLVERARTELESRWTAFVRSRLSQSTRRERRNVETVEFVAKLASLRSGRKAEDLSERDIVNILGNRLASILKRE